jgi:uncharacterized membrane protein
MELVISNTLRWGVMASGAIVLLGVLWFAWTRDTGYARVLPHHLGDLLAFHRGTGPAFFPTSVGAVVTGTVAGKPYAIIGLGLLLLIATPVVRVALSALFFAAQRDWLYVGITLFVLGVLLVSLFTGIG